jgi:hypothetical protein
MIAREVADRVWVMNVWKQSVHRLYEALQNPHVGLRMNCYSHVQRYTKCYILHNFSKPRMDFVDTLYYLTKHIILKVWVEILDFILLSYQRGFWKSALAAPDICTVSHSLYIIVNIWQKVLIWDHKNISDNFLFTINLIFLSGKVLYANNKKGNWQLFMKQGDSSRQSCNTAMYTVTIAVYVTESNCKNKEYKLNFHFSLHPLFLQALTLMQQYLYAMMVANNLWHI